MCPAELAAKHSSAQVSETMAEEPELHLLSVMLNIGERVHECDAFPASVAHQEKMPHTRKRSSHSRKICLLSQSAELKKCK